MMRRLPNVLPAVFVAVAMAAGCRSTDAGGESRSSFSDWWKRTTRRPNVPPAPDGYGSKSRAPSSNPDPFVPPAPAGRDPGASMIGPARAVDSSEPTQIALVSSKGPAESALAGFVRDMNALTRPMRQPRDYRYIVIHHSGSSSGSLRALEDQAGRDGWPTSGWHFVIGNGEGADDGMVEATARWEKQQPGAHLPPNALPQYNLHGIGVCLIGDFNESAPTRRQLDAARALTAYLTRVFDIPPYRVLAAHEAGESTTSRRSPGRHLRIEDILTTSR